MSVLQQPAVKAKYHELFVGAHADFSELDIDDAAPGHAMVARHNPRKLRPLLVFLDAGGKEVARHVGRLNSAEDALLLARFVAGRHYLKTSYDAYRQTAAP